MAARGRADRIEAILLSNKKRMAVYEITESLRKMENSKGPEKLAATIVSATVRQDNKTRLNRGESVRFNIYGKGTEKHGYISLIEFQPETEHNTGVGEQDISKRIEESNSQVRSKLAKEIREMSWQKFEGNLLPLVLEALGFKDVKITQATRDGGFDAECEYTRGLNRSKMIISAKHWTKGHIPYSEVQRMRGINHVADTAAIMTSSTFARETIKEAAPAHNQRSVVLIDHNAIIDACLEKRLGVEEVEIELPTLFRYTGILETDNATTTDTLPENSDSQRVERNNVMSQKDGSAQQDSAPRKRGRPKLKK